MLVDVGDELLEEREQAPARLLEVEDLPSTFKGVDVQVVNYVSDRRIAQEDAVEIAAGGQVGDGVDKPRRVLPEAAGPRPLPSPSGSAPGARRRHRPSPRGLWPP